MDDASVSLLPLLDKSTVFVRGIKKSTPYEKATAELKKRFHR
jgi:hypothetical protein